MTDNPAKKLAKKPARKSTKKRAAVEAFGLIQIKKPIITLHLKLSRVRETRASLERARTASGAVQLRLDARDLHSIYLYLYPTQVKNLIGRLAALALSAPEVSR